jgi:hypothetical protein
MGSFSEQVQQLALETLSNLQFRTCQYFTYVP